MRKLDGDIPVISDGSGEPLILLHCLGVDHRFWDWALPLASRFTLYRYDLPGHGTSPVPSGPYDIGDLADQLHSIVNRLGLAAINIAGISLGGLIAQCFAAKYPQLTRRTILIDTTPRYSDEMQKMWSLRARTARDTGPAALVGDLLNIWFSKAAIDENTASVAYVRSTISRCSGEGYALACEALANADLTAQAPLIKAPTKVICGDDDIPSFIEAAHWLSEHIEGAELSWIPGTRHASVLEKPAEALAIINAFLNRHE